MQLGCVHDGGASAIEVFCRDGYFSVATDLDSDKKKKDSRDLGHHSYNSVPIYQGNP